MSSRRLLILMTVDKHGHRDTYHDVVLCLQIHGYSCDSIGLTFFIGGLRAGDLALAGDLATGADTGSDIVYEGCVVCGKHEWNVLKAVQNGELDAGISMHVEGTPRVNWHVSHDPKGQVSQTSVALASHSGVPAVYPPQTVQAQDKRQRCQASGVIYKQATS